MNKRKSNTRDWIPTCPIDKENPAVCELIPCGHLISIHTAEGISREILSNPENTRSKCPVCKEVWEQIVCLTEEKALEKIRSKLITQTSDMPEGDLKIWFQKILELFLSRDLIPEDAKQIIGTCFVTTFSEKTGQTAEQKAEQTSEQKAGRELEYGNFVVTNKMSKIMDLIKCVQRSIKIYRNQSPRMDRSDRIIPGSFEGSPMHWLFVKSKDASKKAYINAKELEKEETSQTVHNKKISLPTLFQKMRGRIPIQGNLSMMRPGTLNILASTAILFGIRTMFGYKRLDLRPINIQENDVRAINKRNLNDVREKCQEIAFESVNKPIFKHHQFNCNEISPGPDGDFQRSLCPDAENFCRRFEGKSGAAIEHKALEKHIKELFRPEIISAIEEEEIEASNENVQKALDHFWEKNGEDIMTEHNYSDQIGSSNGIAEVISCSPCYAHNESKNTNIPIDYKMGAPTCDYTDIMVEYTPPYTSTVPFKDRGAAGHPFRLGWGPEWDNYKECVAISKVAPLKVDNINEQLFSIFAMLFYITGVHTIYSINSSISKYNKKNTLIGDDHMVFLPDGSKEIIRKDINDIRGNEYGWGDPSGFFENEDGEQQYTYGMGGSKNIKSKKKTRTKHKKTVKKNKQKQTKTHKCRKYGRKKTHKKRK